MYITTNPVNQELFKNFEAVRNRSNNTSVTSKDITAVQKEVKKEKINLPVLCTTALGTLASVLFIRKYQGAALKNPFIKLSGLNDNKLKLNAVIKNVISFFDLDIKLKEMYLLGAGSILGGLSGGIITDKNKNTKNKVKEGIYQFSNVAVPTSLVVGLLELVEKSKISNPKTLIAAKIGAVVAGIGGGMLISSKLCNKIINSFMDKDNKINRTVKLEDGVMQVDDISMALIFAKPRLALKLCVNKIIPLLFLTCGYETGKQK